MTRKKANPSTAPTTAAVQRASAPAAPSVAPAHAPEVTLWCDAEHAPVVQQLAQSLGDAWRIIGVGGARATEVGQLARQFDQPPADDLRKLLVDRPAAFLLLATSQPPQPADVQAALAQSTTLLCLAPAATTLESWHLAMDSADEQPRRPSAGRIIHLAAFTRSPGWRSAADPAQAVASPRSLVMISHARQGQASLFARLLDAWSAVLTLGDLPESIDASLVGPLAKVPQEARDATGHLHAHARMPQGRAALVHVSDQAAIAGRGLTVVGEDAEMHISDHGYSLRALDGHVLEDHPAGAADADDLMQLTLRDLRDWLGRSALSDSPATSSASPGNDPMAMALACCAASLLSCRTGQPESPSNMLRMRA
ncbi:MAG: hypothetical protein WEC36_02420 [Phycisphaeraceae bacterium]